MSIYVVGDVHAEWDILNKFIEEENPDTILQCGDWGYWPAFDGKTELGDPVYGAYGGLIGRTQWNLNDIKNPNTKIHWCDGNHEDHWALKELIGDRENDSVETQPNCFYQSRCSTMMLPDGRRVLFIGGALSIDKEHRTEGVDWFREETISYSDFEHLPMCEIDIVISHTCPTSFLSSLKTGAKIDDPSCEALEYVLDHYKPKQWFHGHFHQYKQGFTKGCHWTCLNQIGEPGAWVKLK
jgi:hypothetical protein